MAYSAKMLVYRISAPKYAGDLSGNGAKLYGGRWNNKGIAVVYLTSSRAMAMMELLVHLRPEDLQRPYVVMAFEVPEDKILKITLENLPKDWKEDRQKSYLHHITADFVREGKYLIMEVPSVLVEEESNYILNPLHPDAKKVKLISQRSFSFDHRLK